MPFIHYVKSGMTFLSILIFSLLIPFCLHANDTILVKPDTSYWKIKKELGIFGSQNAYSAYWKGGGINSIAVNSRIEVAPIYQKDKQKWESRVRGRLGYVKQGKYEFIKNEDLFEMDSKYDHQYSKRVKFSGLFNFISSFYDTYKVERTGERGILVGDFLSPAFINIGSGMDYVIKEKVFSVYYSPINSKISYVMNDSLRAQFLPLENQQSGRRYELGSLFRLVFEKEIMKNVIMKTTSTFFTNHLENFGKFDVNFEGRLNFKINKYLSANIITRIIYDEDILFQIEDENGEFTGKLGPRTQINEVFNIGLDHKF